MVSPVDNRLDSLASEEGLTEVCGLIEIRANLEPEKFTGGEILPLSARLFIEPDTFDRLHRQLMAPPGPGLWIRVSLKLGGASLPPPPSKGLSVVLSSFDLSETRMYAIVGFDVDVAP